VDVNLGHLDAIARDGRVTKALDELWRGRAVEPELKQELWRLARESPAMQHGTEPGARNGLLVSGR
jgi:hypothetical protein